MNSRVRQALNALSSSYTVVVNPDHPLLLRGPDALVSDFGNLVAVFSFSCKSRQNLSSVLARLAISRYALPKGTRCILLTDQAETSDMDLLRNNFHEILADVESRELHRVILHRTHGQNRIPEIPQELRASYYSQYWSALELSRRAFARASDKPVLGITAEHYFEKRDGVRLRSWGRSGRNSTSKLLWRSSDEEMLVSVLPHRRGSVRAAAEKVIEYRARSSFALDNGVMYGDFHGAPSLLLSSVPETTFWDPGKLRRASAFGGWTLLPSTGGASPLSYRREHDEINLQMSTRRAGSELPQDEWDIDEDDEL